MLLKSMPKLDENLDAIWDPIFQDFEKLAGGPAGRAEWPEARIWQN